MHCNYRVTSISDHECSDGLGLTVHLVEKKMTTIIIQDCEQKYETTIRLQIRNDPCTIGVLKIINSVHVEACSTGQLVLTDICDYLDHYALLLKPPNGAIGCIYIPVKFVLHNDTKPVPTNDTKPVPTGK